MGAVVKGLAGGLLGSVAGSLFGGNKQPEIRQPAPASREAPKADPSLDPNRSEAVAEARRRRTALQRRTGRSSLKVDLSGSESGGGQTRSGISIR